MDYREMVQQIGEEKFAQRLKEMKKTADYFIAEAGYEGIVECNERILLNVLLDYFSDIFRLKDFHEIDKVREEKIFAYMIAWIVRRKPLQFVEFSEKERDIFVNERFAIFLLMNECLVCGEKKFVGIENEQKLEEYLDLLLYYFKYREVNPQVLELMIESFKMGSLVSI